MFSALKKLTKSSDDRCPAPMPMSSSLQKKFSRGVHFNMKILIKGDRNVGKSCLLQRLQGGPFIEEYAPTDQIQVAPIHWTYKNSDYIVKVEVWEVVDKGKTKKKPPIGLKLDNQTTPVPLESDYEAPVLDATFLDVYKNASGVILMLDITKPWTFEYVVKELSNVPADLPVVVLGNHCDMQHHRQVHPHHIEQAMYHAKMTRTAPVRYAESSMRNGFGLRLLHKFLSVPFLRLQRTSLLEQLQRNQKDMEETEKELDEFQNSEESHYNSFVDKLVNKRRQNSGQIDGKPNMDRSPSIVLGAGKPIVPPNVNPLLAQSLEPALKFPSNTTENIIPQIKQSQYVSSELTKPRTLNMETSPSNLQHNSGQSTPSVANISTSSGALEEFYAGTLDSSFLEDLTPLPTSHDYAYEIDSDDDNTANPKVNIDQDDLDVDIIPSSVDTSLDIKMSDVNINEDKEDKLDIIINQERCDDKESDTNERSTIIFDRRPHMHLNLDNEFPLWAGDSSVRRSPEGGEDPDLTKEQSEKVEKKHKKKKSKDKDTGDYGDKSERKEKKHKSKKSKSDKRVNPQQDLLPSTAEPVFYCADEYDSI